MNKTEEMLKGAGLEGVFIPPCESILTLPQGDSVLIGKSSDGPSSDRVVIRVNRNLARVLPVPTYEEEGIETYGPHALLTEAGSFGRPEFHRLLGYAERMQDEGILRVPGLFLGETDPRFIEIRFKYDTHLVKKVGQLSAERMEQFGPDHPIVFVGRLALVNQSLAQLPLRQLVGKFPLNVEYYDVKK